ncbi:iron chaperone [Chryseobacterium cucumeris]
MQNTFTNIDEYILLFPVEVQKKLQELRKVIHLQVPDIEEYIGYQMPAFRHKGKPLVYFPDIKSISDSIRELKASVLLRQILKRENINSLKEPCSFQFMKIFRSI